MMITGYSDRINHALAFAAKHHDRQVRKGTRLPYLTHPANVAIILTRYGQDEPTVVAGILHDVVEDCVREDHTPEMLEQRLGEKFGAEVLDTLLSVTLRRTDDEGEPLSTEEQREDYLMRLGRASDLARTIDPDTVWGRFKAGREGTIRWYRAVYDRLHSLGFDAPIMRELEQA